MLRFLGLVSSIPFLLLLRKVTSSGSSAGLSSNFVLFSGAAAVLQMLASSRVLTFCIYFCNSTVIISLLASVYFIFPSQSHDHTTAIRTIPTCLLLSVPVLLGPGVRSFLLAAARCLRTCGIAAQAVTTRQSKRIKIFAGITPVVVLAVWAEAMSSVRVSFWAVGWEMWNLWLTATARISIAIDFLFFVLEAASCEDELPLVTN
jgi:hypothetical protein